jgi:hypothetical protein
MYQFLTKHGQTLAFGIGLLLTVVFLGMVLSSDTGAIEAPDGTKDYSVSMFNFGLWAAILLTVVCAIAMVLFGVVQVASNLKRSWQGLAGLALLVVIFIIGYSVAPAEPENSQIQLAIQKFEESQEVDFSAANLKFVGGAILTSLVMIGLAFLALVVTGVRSFFR